MKGNKLPNTIVLKTAAAVNYVKSNLIKESYGTTVQSNKDIQSEMKASADYLRSKMY